jgi:tRNA A37 methylthiotransferase MiaB
MEGQVPDGIKKERSELLRYLGSKKNLAFMRKFQGTLLRAVLEEGSLSKPGHCSGLTDNYIRVDVSNGKKADFGREINILIEDVQEKRVTGKIIVND